MRYAQSQRVVLACGLVLGPQLVVHGALLPRESVSAHSVGLWATTEDDGSETGDAKDAPRGDTRIGFRHSENWGELLEAWLQRELREVLYGAQELGHADKKLRAGAEAQRNVYFPALRWQQWHSSCVIIFALSFAWLLAYFHRKRWLDKSDIEDSPEMENAEAPLKSWNLKSCLGPPGLSGGTPDMVLVFFHPGFKRDDDGEQVLEASLEQVEVKSNESGWFTDTESGSKQFSASSDDAGDAEGSASSRVGLFSRSASSTCELGTMGDFRATFLQKVWKALKEFGFDVALFSSFHDDQLFVCVNIQNMDTINYILSASENFMQVQRNLLTKLRISQPAEAPWSSPPYILYSPEFAGKLGMEVSELFRGHPRGDGSTSILNAWKRSRMIYQRIIDHVNLRKAVDAKMLADWYLVHDKAVVSALDFKWAGRQHWLDFSYSQPIGEVEDYFGPAIGTFFSWIGFHCKALLALVPVSIILAFLVNSRLNKLIDDVDDYLWDQAQYKVIESILIGIIVSTFSIVVWMRLCKNQWSRIAKYLSVLWDVRDIEKITRPEYRGDMKPSPVDGHILERAYPKHFSYMWQFLSAFVSVLFCAFVFFAIAVWISVFTNNMGKFASLMLCIQIKVFEVIYTAVVKQLIKLENHKWTQDYYRSLAYKLCMFHAVNQYTAFICLMLTPHDGTSKAVLKRHATLRRLLGSTLVVLALFRIIEVVCRNYWVELKLWWAKRQIMKEVGREAEFSTEEKQGKYCVFELEGEIITMTQLVISLGYVLLFGGIQPLVVPLCLIVFTVQLRSTAHLLVNVARRPFPRIAGLDAFEGLLSIMKTVGMVGSALWLIEMQTVYYKGSKLTEVALFVVCILCMFLLDRFVDLVFNANSEEETLLIACRKHVVIQARRAGAHGSRPRHDSSRGLSVRTAADKAVEDADWSTIPQGVALSTPVSSEREPPDDAQAAA